MTVVLHLGVLGVVLAMYHMGAGGSDSKPLSVQQPRYAELALRLHGTILGAIYTMMCMYVFIYIYMFIFCIHA